MTIKLFLNTIDFPLIAELKELKELPGPGEKITLKKDNTLARYEVTEVKKKIDNSDIYIYVNKIW